jgi:hypothetical protein
MPKGASYRSHAGRFLRLGVLAAWTASAFAQAAVPALTDATIADPVGDKELRGAALSPDGAVVHVLVASGTEGRVSPSAPLVWATVDETGRVGLRDQAVLLSTGGTDSSQASSSSVDPSKESGLIARSNGSAVIVHAESKGQLKLVALGAKDSTATTSSVSVASTTPTIRRVVPVDERRVAILGAVGASPIFAIVDIDARTVAVRGDFGSEEATLIGAAFTADGSAVVAGEKGSFPESSAWVARLSTTGAVVASRTLPGRPLDIARSADGTTILLLQRGTLLASEVVLQVLAPDLTPRSERVLVANQRFVQTFRAAAVPSGGFVLAGVKDRGRWLSRIGASGAEVWTDGQDPRTRKDAEIVASIDLLARGDRLAAVYTAFTVEDRRQKKVVRITRFRVS